MRVSLSIWLSSAIALVIMCTGFPANAQSSCENAFGISASPLTAPNHRTVKVQEVRTTQENEEFFVLRRISERSTWLSTYSSGRGFDPQGSPIWGFELLGQNLARVAGFRMELDGSLLVATPETLNRRLEKFNRYLVTVNVRPIPLHFYSQRAAKRIPFLRVWGESAGIPVSSDLQNHTIHDISYHYPGILMPVEIIKLLQTEAQIASAWAEFTQALSTDKDFVALAADASVGLIDNVSVSANHSEGKGFDFLYAERVMKRYFPTLRKETYDAKRDAERFSPLDVFFRRITYLEQTFPQHDELIERGLAAKTVFVEQMKIKHPEWTDTVSSRGFASVQAVRELYVQRAIELRKAADDYVRLYGLD